MMGRSRPRCKLRGKGRTDTKGKAQRVRNTRETKVTQYTTKEKIKTHERKIKTQNSKGFATGQ